MCTAMTYSAGGHYFGRTLDYELSYGEQVVITPRRFRLPFRTKPPMERHYAMIGMATVQEGIPLYYEATNEMGLSAAGLLFADYCRYPAIESGKDNIAPFELIGWLLGQCADLREAKRKLSTVQLAAIPFSEALPLTPLHWLIADRESAITLEVTEAGMKLHENPLGVLTNSPPFDYQLTRLSDYCNLTPEQPPKEFCGVLPLRQYSRGMGAIGLPGDPSSCARFARAAFAKLSAEGGASEQEGISQFFHILGSVEQIKGCVRLKSGLPHTLYTSCCNADRGIYYYTTYQNRCICAVDLRAENLESEQLFCYPLIREQQIHPQN